ncbi:MAG: hypothetical protein ACI9NQ_000072 [Paracoccaceae bacterium]
MTFILPALLLSSSTAGGMRRTPVVSKDSEFGGMILPRKRKKPGAQNEARLWKGRVGNVLLHFVKSL